MARCKVQSDNRCAAEEVRYLFEFFREIERGEHVTYLLEISIICRTSVSPASVAQLAARQSHNHKQEQSEGREFDPHRGQYFFHTVSDQAFLAA